MKRVPYAFTLVELLVVISVITLLIGILLPVLGKARQASQQAVCASNLKQFGVGYQMYCDGNRGWLPQKGPDGSALSETFGPPNVLGVDDQSLWFNAVPKAIGRKSYYDMLLDDQRGVPPLATGNRNSIFTCPSAGPIGTIGSGQASDQIAPDGESFLLYGSDSQGVLKPVGVGFKYTMSYVANASLTNTFANTQSFTAVHMSKLRPAATVVLMVEKLVNPAEYRDVAVQSFIAANPDVYRGLATTAGFISNIGQPKSNWKRFTTRHGGGGNLLFADGHVAYFKWRETQLQPDQLARPTAVRDLNQPSKVVWSIAGAIH